MLPVCHHESKMSEDEASPEDVEIKDKRKRNWVLAASWKHCLHPAITETQDHRAFQLHESINSSFLPKQELL